MKLKNCIKNKKRIINTVEKLNISQKKALLDSLLSSLMADISCDDRQQLLHDILLTNKESRPVIEMVEY